MSKILLDLDVFYCTIVCLLDGIMFCLLFIFYVILIYTRGRHSKSTHAAIDLVGLLPSVNLSVPVQIKSARAPIGSLGSKQKQHGN